MNGKWVAASSGKTFDGEHFIYYLTFAKIDSKNIVRTKDCRTTRQNGCTYRSRLKHTNTKITKNIITQAGNK